MMHLGSCLNFNNVTATVSDSASVDGTWEVTAGLNGQEATFAVETNETTPCDSSAPIFSAAQVEFTTYGCAKLRVTIEGDGCKLNTSPNCYVRRLRKNEAGVYVTTTLLHVRSEAGGTGDGCSGTKPLEPVSPFDALSVDTTLVCGDIFRLVCSMSALQCAALNITFTLEVLE